MLEPFQILKSEWENIKLGIQKAKHDYHSFVLSTSSSNGPDSRTVILRALDEDKPAIWFHSDKRSKKILHLKKDKKVSALFYDKYRKITEVYPGNKYFLINLVQYLSDNQQLNLIKSKNLSLRMLDKKKIKKNRLTIEIINIILPVVLLSLFSIFFKLYETKKYA